MDLPSILAELSTARTIIGITGPPGAGKSMLAAQISAAVASCVVVGMDGFHLADEELGRLGRSGRKGAPDTFDVEGFVSTLARIRAADAVVYVPRFHRTLEAAVAGSICVVPTTRLVVVEGNYLLLQTGAWRTVRGLLDECWYVDVDDQLRVAELVARHVSFGRSPEAAGEWVARSDEANARLVAGTRHLADRWVGRLRTA